MIRLSRTSGVLPTAWVTSSRMGIAGPFAGTGPVERPGGHTASGSVGPTTVPTVACLCVFQQRVIPPHNDVSRRGTHAQRSSRVALDRVERQAARLVVGLGGPIEPAQ